MVLICDCRFISSIEFDVVKREAYTKIVKEAKEEVRDKKVFIYSLHKYENGLNLKITLLYQMVR